MIIDEEINLISSESLLDGILEDLEVYGFTQIKLQMIWEYSHLIPNLVNQRLDKWNGMKLANKFLVAEEQVSELISVVDRVKGLLYADRKKAAGIAFLEKSADYITLKSIKSTETAKTSYADIDEDFQKLKKKEAMMDALSNFLYRKHEHFKQAHHMCKQLYSTDNNG